MTVVVLDVGLAGADCLPLEEELAEVEGELPLFGQVVVGTGILGHEHSDHTDRSGGAHHLLSLDLASPKGQSMDNATSRLTISDVLALPSVRAAEPQIVAADDQLDRPVTARTRHGHRVADIARSCPAETSC